MNGIEEQMDLNEPSIELDEIYVNSEGTDKDLNKDYDLIREKVITAIERASEVLDASVIAVKSDSSPRAIEATSSILKSIVDNSKCLLDIHDKIRGIQQESDETQSNGVKEDDGKIKGNVTTILKAINGSKE